MKLLFTLLVFLSFTFVSAQNYQLIWEDNFDGTSLDSSVWNIEQKIGIWNTGGNKELQHYKKENVNVGPDGEGNNCLILTAKKEVHNGYQFTSGKVTTKGKLAFRRGKLEASIKIPNLANGLWPAFWTLGYTPIGWPDCGEIDVLEMGHKTGISTGKQNNYIGAHLFWGPYPSDWGKNYVASENLSTGFFKHTVIWDESKISVYFNDAKSPYFTMGIDGNTTEEFRNYQHYILLNMAIGGSLPGITNVAGITAKMPANMYIDWVRIYQEEGKKDFATNELPLYGTFGVFEEDPSGNMRMDLNFDLFNTASGANVKQNETPQNGSKVLSYNCLANQNVEIKLTSGLKRNMVNYAKGSIRFYLKTNAKGPIQVGFADAQGKQAFLTLGKENKNTVEPNGEWHSSFIPLESIASQVNLAALKDLFILKGNFTEDCFISIDEVSYSETSPVISGNYAIYSNNTAIADKFKIDNVNGHLYNWDGTVTFNDNIPAYDGEEVLSFKSSGAAGWWGFGLFSAAPMNFESFSDGYLQLALRTYSTQTFKIAIQGAGNTEGSVSFVNGKDKYNFKRDGRWHQLTIPMADLLKLGLDLSDCGNIFTMSGSSIGDIAIDDIYLSNDSIPLENAMICRPVSLTISPKTATIKAGKNRTFKASAKNQFGNSTDAYVVWSASGGSINEKGLFTADVPGTYTVWAKQDALVDSATVKVDNATGIEPIGNQIELKYFNETKEIQLQGLSLGEKIVVTDLSGRTILQKTINSEQISISLANYPKSVYVVHVKSEHSVMRFKLINH